MGVALAMVPIVLYPVFRRFDPVLAIGYVVFRGAIETVTYVASAAALLALWMIVRGFSASRTSLT